MSHLIIFEPGRIFVEKQNAEILLERVLPKQVRYEQLRLAHPSPVGDIIIILIKSRSYRYLDAFRDSFSNLDTPINNLQLYKCRINI